MLVCGFFDGKSSIGIEVWVECEKGKKKEFGVRWKEGKKGFGKEGNGENGKGMGFNECREWKVKVGVEMIKRGWSDKWVGGKYVVCERWFSCEYVMGEVRKVGKGGLDVVGLGKMGNGKYVVDGKLENGLELIGVYEREGCDKCGEYKWDYICLEGKVGEEGLGILVIGYGRKERWKVLIRRDLCMSFVKGLEV